MKSHHSLFAPARRRASALVIVLSCIVIISMLLISYLAMMQLDRMTTHNYNQTIKAQELAQGALQEILGDLRQEINAGSLQDGTPAETSYTKDNVRVFIPTSSTANLPARIGFPVTDYTSNNLPPTLLRVSRATDAFFTSPLPAYTAANLPPNRASAASSTTRSANGRILTAQRWNKPLLMGTSAAPAFASNPPDWVYVTRAGSRVCTVADLPNLKNTTDLSGTNVVLGRYAFVMYEQGGLLDLNTAGYPSTVLAETDGTTTIAGKSYIAYADLTQLPGLTGTSQVDQIINWRSKGSLARNANKFIPATASSATNGFLKFQAEDSPLLGRQDLIEYFKQTPVLKDSLDALKYLGTFSRAVNAPTWTPTATVGNPAGNTIDYAGQAEKSTAANRNLPNVRFTTAATVTHYDDNGAPTTYSVQKGDPLIQRRFSLGKLAWLTPSGPKSGMAEAIQKCFGLKWNSGKWRWDYVGSTGATVQSSIKTLDTVASENREPTFFELLKAGILSGSLGRDPGTQNANCDHGWPIWDNKPGVMGSLFDTYGTEVNLQILKIGADIIDQADADSYPTALYLGAFDFSTAPADDLAFNTVYGTENLPYLTRVGPIAVADPAPIGTSDTNSKLKFWVQPEVWNPHQPPTVAPSAAPKKFRAYAYGVACGIWSYRGQPANFGSKTYYDDGTGGGIDKESGSIYFNDTSDASSPFYKNPRLLTLDLVDKTATPATNCYAFKYGHLKDDEYNPNQFAAFYTGEAPYSFTSGVAADGDAPQIPEIDKCIVANPCVYYSLQYQGPDGNWHPYNFIARITQNLNDPRNGTLTINGYRAYGSTIWTIPRGSGSYQACRPDPRTDRFSVSQVWGKDWDAEQTMNPSESTGVGDNLFLWPNNPAFTFDSKGSYKLHSLNLWSINDPSYPWVSARYSSSGKAYYSDPDGVVRLGDCYRANMPEAEFSPVKPSTGDGCQLYHYDNAVSSRQIRRPVILNRPFRSVGELGFAYRDQPYKSLDFWSPTSADGALLDLFSTVDEPAVVAGKVNLNTAPAPVLQTILVGASKNNDTLKLQISGSDAKSLAERITADISGNGPYLNRSDLANRLETPIKAAFDTTDPIYSNWANKAHGEAPMRALANNTNTRTWNLLIDIVAQTGRISPKATTLNDFLVEGERRYWLHIAIDRFTGKIVDQQLEPVYE